jgi:hypothetical protein
MTPITLRIRKIRLAMVFSDMKIPGNMNDTLAPGTLNSIVKQAGMKERR